jgi:ribosomal protein S18 acetylase RimI-like enzyme
VYVLGVVPRAPPGWRLDAFADLAQMVCPSPIDMPDGPDIIELSEAHRADVLALTTLVYPHYFRPRTMDLGRYFGIYRDGRLAAMIGERLGTEAHQEMSAICTHPDFSGRGFARRLTAWLGNDVLAQGRMPFLHVSHENARARALYQRMGFRLRRDIGFWSLQRT